MCCCAIGKSILRPFFLLDNKPAIKLHCVSTRSCETGLNATISNAQRPQNFLKIKMQLLLLDCIYLLLQKSRMTWIAVHGGNDHEVRPHACYIIDVTLNTAVYLEPFPLLSCSAGCGNAQCRWFGYRRIGIRQDFPSHVRYFCVEMSVRQKC